PHLLAHPAADLVEERAGAGGAVDLGQHVLVGADPAAPAARPAERVAPVLRRGAPLELPLAILAVALGAAEVLAHLAHPLAQVVYRAGLAVGRPCRVAIAQPLGRLAHVALGLAQCLPRRLACLSGEAALQFLGQLAQRLLAVGERPRVAALGLAVRCRLVARPALLALPGRAVPAALELTLQLLEARV